VFWAKDAHIEDSVSFIPALGGEISIHSKLEIQILGYDKYIIHITYYRLWFFWGVIKGSMMNSSETASQHSSHNADMDKIVQFKTVYHISIY